MTRHTHILHIILKWSIVVAVCAYCFRVFSGDCPAANHGLAPMGEACSIEMIEDAGGLLESPMIFKSGHAFVIRANKADSFPTRAHPR